MTIWEQLRLRLGIITGNIERLSITVGDNQVDAFLLIPTRRVRNKGILYLHGGTFDIEKEIISRFTDAISYRVMGYHVLILKFPDEDFPVPPNPNSDVIEIRDAYNLIKPMVTEVNIVTVSRGGYPGLLAFKDYSNLFSKIVCFVPPLNPDNTQWFEAQADWAKKYLSQCKSPIYHALQGAYKGIESRMLMIGGRIDTTCPPSINSEAFAKLTGCKSVIIQGYGHNAHMSTEGRSRCMEFIAEKF